jgi:hypothetical protein
MSTVTRKPTIVPLFLDALKTFCILIVYKSVSIGTESGALGWAAGRRTASRPEITRARTRVELPSLVSGAKWADSRRNGFGVGPGHTRVAGRGLCQTDHSSDLLVGGSYRMTSTVSREAGPL